MKLFAQNSPSSELQGNRKDSGLSAPALHPDCPFEDTTLPPPRISTPWLLRNGESHFSTVLLHRGNPRGFTALTFSTHLCAKDPAPSNNTCKMLTWSPKQKTNDTHPMGLEYSYHCFQEMMSVLGPCPQQCEPLPRPHLPLPFTSCMTLNALSCLCLFPHLQQNNTISFIE